METKPPTAGRLSVREKVGYALGDTATNFVWRGVIIFLPFFHTDVLGITAAASGTLLLICRFWDGISDIAVGLIADRTRTRWGKFRPWILWTAVPFGVTAVLVFWAPDLDYTGKLIWAYATYSGLILLYTLNNVPYSTLMGVMSPDPDERASISSYRLVFAFLGGLLMQGMALGMVAYFGSNEILIDLFGQRGDRLGYKVTMTLFSAVGVVLFIITFLSTRERVQPITETATLKRDIRDLLSNRPWLILFGVGVLFVTFTTLRGGGTLYYFAHYVGNQALAASYMVAGLLGAMLGAAITGNLTRLVGKRRLMIYSMLVMTVAGGLLYVPGPQHIAAIFVLGTIAEFASGPIVTLFFAMLADAADYSEWRTGQRATGLVYSAGTISMKFGSGVGGAMTGWMLAMYGYVEATDAIQRLETIEGIRVVISVIPAIVGVGMLLIFLFYRLHGDMLDQVARDLEQRRETTGRALAG